MRRRYVTLDVFTDRPFGGNPLAVVLDAEGLSSAEMQAIATEFNYSETTFVLPPRQSTHTAQVRIFTSRIEVPFAGHPNVGTAVAVARDLQSRGLAVPAHFVFDELAGLVHIRLQREGGTVVGAEITAPERLSVRAEVAVQDAAECLSLPQADIVAIHHRPCVVSVGLPFLAVEVASRRALRNAKPSWAAHERVLPRVGTDAVYAYWRGGADGELHARVFSPLDATIEDPATGSATGAVIALLASLAEKADEDRSWRAEQGVDMGRASVIMGRTEKRGGVVTGVHIAGKAVHMMQGEMLSL
ncbi:MAG TPA: PhzF family phenazine biosynthesis protein [Steroidobacteraceae bacterium]|nr:PhzF family phenazine biosynthesis protein [Steroidobacteraceae bacterium]